MTEPTPAELSGLIASIYDRAIDPDGWGQTLGQLRTALGAGNAALSLIDLRTERFLLNFFDQIPDRLISQFARLESQAVKLWGGADAIKSLPLDEPAILSRVNPSAREGSNNYRDEFVAEGFADAMTLGLARDGQVVGACIFGRARSAGRFREEEIALARLLLPHLQRALAFSRMFELATLRANAFEAALEAVSVPTLLVSARGELVHANSSGHAELERGESLRIVGDRVAATDAACRRELSDAIETARDRPDASPAQLDVPLHASSSEVRLLPLPRDSLRGLLAPSASVTIVLTSKRRPAPRDEQAIAARLIGRDGLTKSEAAVALEIAKGDGRAAAAARLGISDNTVRTHLSSIFLKLAINRQAQLVRLIEEESGGYSSAAAAREAS